MTEPILYQMQGFAFQVQGDTISPSTEAAWSRVHGCTPPMPPLAPVTVRTTPASRILKYQRARITLQNRTIDDAWTRCITKRLRRSQDAAQLRAHSQKAGVNSVVDTLQVGPVSARQRQAVCRAGRRPSPLSAAHVAAPVTSATAVT